MDKGSENGSVELLELACAEGENLERTFDHTSMHMYLQV
jgi:hypothetical protein